MFGKNVGVGERLCSRHIGQRLSNLQAARSKEHSVNLAAVAIEGIGRAM